MLAWELRGDNPEAYTKGNIENAEIGYWARCGKRKNEQNNLENNIVMELFYRYHFDVNVKYEGDKREAFKIDPFMIDAIIEVQKCMQIFVRERGISIESNPSSNVSISNFERYDKHPILNMYNLGLENNPNILNKNPQLSVSINTDDQGVFDTLLENEFALMSIALEKVKDENGNAKYTQAEIYDWIDRVREMGIEQSFRINRKFEM